jgi:two-component system, cell cycle sensor histidine kinase and response regulator CckA
MATRSLRRRSRASLPASGLEGPTPEPDVRDSAALKATVDAIDALIVVARADGSILTWNRRCEESAGVSFSEVAGKPIWDVMRLPTRGRPKAQEALDRLVAGREPVVVFTTQWVRRDGRRARIGWTARCLDIAPGVRVIVATGGETTRSAQAAREFAETEVRYETLLELLPESLIVHQDGRIVFANRVAAELYADGDPATLMGADIMGLIAPSNRALVGALIAIALAGGVAVPPARRRHLHGDGSEFDVEVAAKRVSFNGRPALEIIARDVSERVAVENARADSEARVRAIFNDSSVGMMLFDAAGLGLESNGALHRLLGYDHDELTRLPVLEYTHQGDREASRRAMDDLFAGRVSSYELVQRYIRKDATVVWARVHVAAVQGAGSTTSLAVGTVEDVTAHRELEEQLNHASKMEALGRLAGGVAHDFNNLLTVVNGYADLLAASLAGDPRAADAAEIRQAGARATELTAQLLAFGRRAPRSAERFELNKRIAAVVPMLRRLLSEDIAFETEFDERLGAVDADPGQLEQVVMNLVVNARDAMPGGGQLKLTTGLLPLPTGAPDPLGRRWARIEVADSGVGIAPEVVDRIFEPFFTTKELGRGTGLGLATAYGIVEQMGGHIHVHSTVGLGSRFQVDIPQSAGADSPAEAAHGGTSGRGSETILIVEDETAVRDFCKRALQAEGYRVVATGPKDAMSEAATLGSALDLLVSDVVMPELDGPTIAAALTARRPDLRVLFMSGYPRDLEGEISGVVAAGAILSKPFDARQLAAAVRRALDRPLGPRDEAKFE